MIKETSCSAYDPAPYQVVPVGCAELAGAWPGGWWGAAALSCMMVRMLLQAVAAISLEVRSSRWSHMAARACTHMYTHVLSQCATRSLWLHPLLCTAAQRTMSQCIEAICGTLAWPRTYKVLLPAVPLHAMHCDQQEKLTQSVPVQSCNHQCSVSDSCTVRLTSCRLLWSCACVACRYCSTLLAPSTSFSCG